MKFLTRLQSWFRATVHRPAFERRMDDEMETHLALYEADLRRAGLTAEEARRRARAEFGSVEARKDECREATGLRLLGELRGDVTYTLRLLRRSPVFTAVALLSLGLGIGANTAIFSLIDTVLLKSLPVEDPQRLFFVDNSGGKEGGRSGPPYPCYEILRDKNRFFAGMAAFDDGRLKVTIDGTPEQLRTQYASGTYFDVLGVHAVHGRTLTGADDSTVGRGGPDGAVAVISHDLWKRRFHMDPAVVGKSIQVGSHWVTIVGVTPPGFFGLQAGSPIDVTIPMSLVGDNLGSRELWWLSVVGRLQPDASVDQARADLENLFDAYMTDIGKPRERRGYFSGIELVPAAKGFNGLRREFSEPLLIVMTIVAVVLLIGCANVANLLLARASARQNEMSVRLAIGASRGRLVRQLLTEGAVLVSCGALVGLVFAGWGVSFLVGLFAAGGNGIVLDPRFDLRVLGFTSVIAALTAVLFSLAPALHATRVDAAKPLGRRRSLTSPRLRVGQALVIVQVMLAVVLLSGAALFVRTLRSLTTIEPGFDREGVLTMQVEATVPDRKVRPATALEHRQEHARLGAIWEDFIGGVVALPGVSSAAAATMSPLSGRDRGVVIAVSGAAPLSEHNRGIHVNQVTAGYFDTWGIRVLRGRSFTPRDRAASARVAILNETAARSYFGSENPIGRRVNLPGQRVEDEYEIVGVVADTRYVNLRTPDERMVYVPIEQSIDPITATVVAVRGPGDVTHLASSVRETVRKTVPAGFVTRIGTIEQQIQRALVRERLLSMLATFFAVLALTLACIGLYGVMAYAVIRRTREIGIRIAIGARQGSVIWMVLRDTVALVIAGAALGLIAALNASRYIESQLFGVAPDDPVALFVAILLLLAVTAIAGYLPARRASRIEPVIALRYE